MAKSLARQVGAVILGQATSGASMEAHYVSYAPKDAQSGDEPPAPPEAFDFISALSLFEGPEPERSLIRGKAALVQRLSAQQIERWISDWSKQGVQFIDCLSVDLSNPENESQVCSKLFMLPDDHVWHEIENHKHELRILPKKSKQQLQGLIIMAKMNINLPQLLEGSGPWRSFVAQL